MSPVIFESLSRAIMKRSFPFITVMEASSIAETVPVTWKSSTFRSWANAESDIARRAAAARLLRIFFIVFSFFELDFGHEILSPLEHVAGAPFPLGHGGRLVASFEKRCGDPAERPLRLVGSLGIAPVDPGRARRKCEEEPGRRR